jgi:hypothetical protein
MSDRDFYSLREMIRKLQRRVAELEKQVEEKSTTT